MECYNSNLLKRGDQYIGKLFVVDVELIESNSAEIIVSTAMYEDPYLNITRITLQPNECYVFELRSAIQKLSMKDFNAYESVSITECEVTPKELSGTCHQIKLEDYIMHYTEYELEPPKDNTILYLGAAGLLALILLSRK